MLGRKFFTFSFAASALLCLIESAQGHIQLSQPLPIRSPLNKAESNPDYDYTTPLSKDGSNFPCKNYHKAPGLKPTAEYIAGQTYTMTTAGSATHGGGSCQVSLSYDNGASFKVIQSYIGGCPLTGSGTFQIPPGAPNGQALFAWTWINLVGNREYYMNCAVVTISGSNGSGFSGPEIFKANLDIFGPTCKTIENTELVYPNPGPKVIYGGDIVGPNTPASQIAGCPASNNGGSGPAPAPAPVPAPGTTTTKAAGPTTTVVAPPTTTTVVNNVPTAAPAPGTVTVTATVTETKIEYVTVTKNGYNGPRPTGKPYERRQEIEEVDSPTFHIQSDEQGDGCVVGKVICIDDSHVGVCVDEWKGNAQDMGAIPHNTICVEGELVERK